MRFLSVYKTRERAAPPSPEELERMGKLITEGRKAGFLLGVEGCLLVKQFLRVAGEEECELRQVYEATSA